MTQLFDWRAHLEVHPAAELFPRMSEAELKELAEDIKVNGLVEPVVTWAKDSNLLLDGRSRLDAMALAGLLGVGENGYLCDVRSQNKIKLQFFTDGDPYAIALSLNVHRRHLTGEQKRDLIAKLLKANPNQADRRIAEQVKADHKTVGSVRAEQEATGEIPQLKKTTGKDGRTRTAKKQKISTKEKPGAATINVDDVAPSADAMKAKHAAMVEAEQPAEQSDFDLVEYPERVRVNILDTISQSCAVVRAYKKILKVSSLDQGAKDEVSTAIGRLITQWRSLQASLAQPPSVLCAAAFPAASAA